jgi:Tol biopolymer transport system component
MLRAWRTPLLRALGLCALLLAAGCGSTSTRAPAPTLAPGGGTGRVAYTCRDTTGGASINICTSNLDGTGALQLTRVSDAEDALAPRWSRDGNRILFQVRSSGNVGAADVYEVLSDGSGEINLTNNPIAHNGGAAWSPDSQRIVFHAQRDAAYTELYVMDAGGGNVQRLSQGIWAQFPDWSPDGTHIVFMGNMKPTTGEDDWDIYVVGADGSGRRTLVTELGLDAGPVWSPDGGKILYTGPAGPPKTSAQFECFVVNADGSGKTQLTHTADGSSTCGDWSPDGSKIIFTRTTARGGQVWIMNADSSAPKQLPNPPGDLGGLVWQP